MKREDEGIINTENYYVLFDGNNKQGPKSTVFIGTRNIKRNNNGIPESKLKYIIFKIKIKN